MATVLCVQSEIVIQGFIMHRLWYGMFYLRFNQWYCLVCVFLSAKACTSRYTSAMQPTIYSRYNHLGTVRHNTDRRWSWEPGYLQCLNTRSNVWPQTFDTSQPRFTFRRHEQETRWTGGSFETQISHHRVICWMIKNDVDPMGQKTW